MSEEVKFIFSMDDQFTRKAKQAESSVVSLDDKMARLQGVAASVGGALALGKIKDFLWSTVESFGRLEQFQTSLTTMFQGNRKEAELLTGQLQDFAKSTPFELTEIQEATKMMLAYGSTSGGVVKEMTMLGDISSGVGAPLKDIAYLYGTLRTQGRAYAMDIRQFAGRGIPIIEALAKQFKVSKNEVMKLVEQGKVGFPQVEAALKSMTQAGGQFSGMMEQQSKTLNGQLSNMADAWEQLKTSIGESQSGIVKSTVAWMTSMLSTLNSGLAVQKQIGQAFAKGGAKEWSLNEMRQDIMGGKGQWMNDMKINAMVQAAVKKASGDEVGIAKTQIAFSGMINRLLEKKDKMSPTEFNRQMAIIKAGKSDLDTALVQVKKDKAQKAESAASAAAMKKDKESAKVKSQQYTQININIDEMIGVNKLESKTEQSIGADIGETILKNMTEAVEDAQIVAGI